MFFPLFYIKKGNPSLNTSFFFWSLPNWSEHLHKTQKCIYGLVECSFDNPAENLSPRNRNFLTSSLSEVVNFLEKQFSTEMFLWTRRMHFRQPCRSFFSQSAKIFAYFANEIHEIHSNCVILTLSFPKCSSGQEHYRIPNPPENFLLNA